MGLLADFGRSNAYNVSQNLLGQLQQYGQMQVQGAQHNLANTMAVNKAATDIQKSNLEMNAIKQQQEALFAPRDVKSSVLYLSLPEEARPEFLKAYVGGGYADENGMTNMFKRNQFLQESKEGVSVYFEGLKMKAAKGLDAAMQKFDKAQISGDPEAIGKAEKELRYWTAQDAAIGGKFKEALAALGVSDKQQDQWESRIEEIGGKKVMIRKNLKTGKEEQVAAGPGEMNEVRPYSQYIGTTEDKQNAIVFNARTGDMTTKPLPGGVLPGVKSKKALPATEAETLGKMKTTWQDIGLARQAWNEGLTGAFQGRTNEALQAVRNHPAFETLRRRTNRLITVAYALSGKQISEKEIQILKKSILPQVEQMDQNFLVALNELEDWVKRNIQNAQEAYEKSNYQFEPVNLGTPKPSVSPKSRFEIIQVK